MKREMEREAHEMEKEAHKLKVLMGKEAGQMEKDAKEMKLQAQQMQQNLKQTNAQIKQTSLQTVEPVKQTKRSPVIKRLNTAAVLLSSSSYSLRNTLQRQARTSAPSVGKKRKDAPSQSTVSGPLRPAPKKCRKN